MSPGEFGIALERLRGRALCLYFHVMGEPLLHPEIGLLLEMAGASGFPVNLTTNGTLLGTAGEGLLGKPALRQLNVSLHSRSELGADSEYLDGVLSFVNELRSKNKTIIALRLWNRRDGMQDGNTALIIDRLAREFGCDRKNLDSMGDNRGVKLAEGVYLNLSAQFTWPSLDCEEIGSKGFCMGLRDQVGILCDGTVVPCCLDGGGELALGNIFIQSLEEISATPRATAIYDGFSRREAVEELCRRCGYRQRFD